MHIQRSRSRLSFRKRRRRSGGCVSILFSILVLGGVGVVSWLWINRIVSGPATSASNANLMASAQNAFNRGDLSGAISLTRQILLTQPDDADALRLLVRSLVYRSYSEYNRGARSANGAGCRDGGAQPPADQPRIFWQFTPSRFSGWQAQ